MLLRGNRSSAAVLSGGEDADELASLADDVLLYSGLGCRSVSLLFVPRGYDFGPLQSVMSGRIGSLAPNHRNNYRQARAMTVMSGAAHIDAGAVLLVDTGAEPDFSPRPGVLHYAYYNDPAEVAVWIDAHDDTIQCIASNLPFPHSRTVPFGQTQHPGLADYPDGLDTIKFLETI
jgi:hypothetical protein